MTFALVEDMFADLVRLRASARFLAFELRRAGVDVRVLDLDTSLMEARLGAHCEILVEIGGNGLSHATALLASDKARTRERLQGAGLRVPAGAAFRAGDVDRALATAQDLGFPLVVKPVFGTNGAHVHMGLSSLVEVKRAMDEIALASSPDERVLIEEEFRGVEHRVLVTRSGDYAVIRRDPPFVIGDGARSVAALVEAETRRRTEPRTSCLGAIVLDVEAERCLARFGMTPHDVPADGQQVYVRANSNLSTGGFAEDVTDVVHPSVIELALRALALFPGLPVAGLDFMTTDITAPQDPSRYRFLEVNPLPGIGMHLAPGAGSPRDVARCLAEMLFPEILEAPRPLGPRAIPARTAPPPEASVEEEVPVTDTHHPIVGVCFGALTEAKDGEPFVLAPAGAATIEAALMALLADDGLGAAVSSIVQLASFLAAQHGSPTAAGALLTLTARVVTPTLMQKSGGASALSALRNSAEQMQAFEGRAPTRFEPPKPPEAGQAKAGPMARFALDVPKKK